MTDIKPEGLEAARNAIRYLSHPETPWSDEQVAAVINAYLTAAPPSPAPAESGAVAWMTADGRIATDETKRTAMASPSRAAFNIPLFPHPSPPCGGEGELLATMAKHLGWELDWGPREPDDEEGEYGWRVHDRRGNRSDLEWTLIGFGASPADALRAALRSQP